MPAAHRIHVQQETSVCSIILQCTHFQMSPWNFDKALNLETHDIRSPSKFVWWNKKWNVCKRSRKIALCLISKIYANLSDWVEELWWQFFSKKKERITVSFVLTFLNWDFNCSIFLQMSQPGRVSHIFGDIYFFILCNETSHPLTMNKWEKIRQICKRVSNNIDELAY